MDQVEIVALLEKYSLFDEPIVEHGFTPYNRDYRVVGEWWGPPGPGEDKRRLHATGEYLLRGCVEAHYHSLVRPPSFSLDDVFIDYEQYLAAYAAGSASHEFVWAVGVECYPGISYVEDSERARFWTDRLSRPMHELLIETNAYRLTLVFAELVVTVTPCPPPLEAGPTVP